MTIKILKLVILLGMHENSSLTIESLHDYFLNTFFNKEKKCLSFCPVEQNFKMRSNKDNISMLVSKLQILFVIIIITNARVFENHDYNYKLGTA